MTELPTKLLVEVIVPLLQVNVDVQQLRESEIEELLDKWCAVTTPRLDLLLIARNQQEVDGLVNHIVSLLQKKCAGVFSPMKKNPPRSWYQLLDGSNVPVKMTVVARSDEKFPGVSPNKCMLVLGDKEAVHDFAPFKEVI